MAALVERLVDQLGELRLRARRAVRAGVVAIAAGAGEHREPPPSPVLAQHQDAGAFDRHQRGELRQHAFGEALQRALVEERRRRVDDDLEPAARLHQPQQLLVAAERRRQRGEELVGGQLGLRLVVVDVVVDDDAALRRLAGLAGAQDDAHGLVLQLLADELHELEPRPLRLHHHVEQDHRHVGMAAEELARLRRRARREAAPARGRAA